MDLIERLIDEADGYGDGPVVMHDIEGLRALLREAAAALEAEREDVDKVIFRIEKYANDQERDPIVVPSSRLRAWASDLRAAIDQARNIKPTNKRDK